MASTTRFTVDGMTCGHCVGAVAAELEAIEAVRSASVDLSTGVVEVVLDGPVSVEDLAAAVDEAGYRMVPS